MYICREMNWNPFKRWKAMKDYVVADPSDNCLTLSKHLYESMRLLDYDDIRVLTFRTPDGGYGFCINPEQYRDVRTEDSVFVPMMFDTKGKTVGFESRCPTLNRVFYDWGLPIDRPVKLSVETVETKSGQTVYMIKRPRR